MKQQNEKEAERHVTQQLLTFSNEIKKIAKESNFPYVAHFLLRCVRQFRDESSSKLYVYNINEEDLQELISICYSQSEDESQSTSEKPLSS